MKADFASMPPIAQAAMLDLLCGADPNMAAWWKELLLGEPPASVVDLFAGR